MLGPMLKYLDAISSPLLHAHFVNPLTSDIDLKHFVSSFNAACATLKSVTLDTPVRDAVAGLHPHDGRLTGARLVQEQTFLQQLGCPASTVMALTEGALPLRFIVHDLDILRQYVKNPRLHLQLRDDFFADEKALLLDDSLDNVPLQKAKKQKEDIEAASTKDLHPVLQLMRTIYSCSELVEFTRENPEAQDAGLASVLSNSRDLQHASFQTFINCTPFINPFVAASAKYGEAFTDSFEKLKELRKANNEREPKLRDVECLGLPLRGNSSLDGGDGFWKILSELASNGSTDIKGVQKSIEKMSTSDQIEGLQKMIRDQNGSTDVLIALCKQAIGPDEVGMVRIHLPATDQPFLECEIGNIFKSGPEYNDLVYRATLQKNLDPALEQFTSQAREVLRAFNAACVLFSEGHIEFRSRVLTFDHSDGSHTTNMLQALQGKWASTDNSVIEQACVKYPELVCLTPSELVRMSELMRGISMSGDLTSAEATKLSQRWRSSRNRTIKESEDACHRSEMIEGDDNSAPALTEFKIVPAGALPQQTKGNEGLILEGCSFADGAYSEGLWFYKRSDGAVLVPVAGGWAVYQSPKYMAPCLLASVSDHHHKLEPWEMGDWRVADGTRGLSATPSLEVAVQADANHVVPLAWSDDGRTRDEDIFVKHKQGVPPLDVTSEEVAGALYVRSVERYSLWESMGFERGMRILAVDGSRGTPSQLLSRLTHCTENKASTGFKVRVESTFVWNTVSKDVDVSANGRDVHKTRGTKPSLACSQPQAGGVWRVKVTGDVYGMRIGLCTSKLDHHLSEVDSGRNKDKAYWLMRCGSLRHDGQDVATTRAFRSDDIITISHDTNHRSIEFALNGKDIGAKFTNVSTNVLRPCVYLAKKTANVTLSPNAPVNEVPKWNPNKLSAGIQLHNDRSVASLSSKATFGVVTGDTVLSGPGPHTFEVMVTGQNFSEGVYVGVAPPGVCLHAQFEPSSMYGLTVRPDGNVFGLHESKILYSGQKPTNKQQDMQFTFTVDLGEGSIDVARNGTRVVHSSLIADFPKARGPLVPYAVILRHDIQCALLRASKKVVNTQSPSVVIRSTRGIASPADGLYKKWIPTYTRSDESFNVFFWDGKWCVADAADTPCAWGNAYSPERPLGSEPIRWTVVKNFQATPKYLRIVTPAKPGGVLKLQSSTVEGKVVYSNAEVKLSWCKSVHKWAITPVSTSKNPTFAYYVSATTSAWLPHYCTNWFRGDGATWHHDNRIYLEPCTALVSLKQDANGLVWPKQGKQRSGDKDVRLGLEKPYPVISLGSTMRSATSRGKSVMDAMKIDELAGWHVLHKACGVLCRAPELRLALEQASVGLENGKELRFTWGTAEETLEAISNRAANQLERIGKLFKKFKGSVPLDPLISSNHSQGIGEQLQTTIDAPVIDTSRLSVTDRKFFLLSLFNEGLRPYHILDCGPYTPVEDVRAFLLLYKLTKQGRLAITNLQELSPDLQNEVRQIADVQHEEKGLVGIITSGDGTDETVSFVDNQSCDVRWKKWAMERVVKLCKFESITYFCGGPGTGKSYTIKQQTELGVWGNVAPTLLDIDCTKTSLDSICKRLMAPLRATTGLLIIHVGHDASHSVVNQVLDSLIFLGRVQSQSGLSVITPKRGWHLVVEFQHPPKPEVGRTVNDPWKRPDGTSDITLLACRGLASQGNVIPFKIAEVPGAEEALQFLRGKVPELPADNVVLAKLLALGLDPETHVSEQRAVLETATPRMITRSLRFLVQQFSILLPISSQATLSQLPVYKLVALALMHEMRHFINPSAPDHFHLVLRKEITIRGSVQLSGKISTKLKDALDEYHRHLSRRLCIMKRQTNAEAMQAERERSEAHRAQLDTAPLYALIDILADEVGVKKKWVTTCLSNSKYVLIPDFLQKLVQLRAHIFLKDPPVLQGPSGTGKTYAVSVLSELLQLPSDSSSGKPMRSGFNDLLDTLFKKFIRSAELKKLFPSSNSDVEVGGVKVLWTAQCHKPTDNAKECLQLLAEHNLSEAMNYMRVSINDVLGPLINDVDANPDLTRLLSNDKFANSVQVMNGNATDDLEKVCDSLVEVIEQLAKVNGCFLAAQTKQCVESALRSEVMRDMAGTTYDALVKVLDRKHVYESFKTWAEYSFIKAGNNRDEFCRQVRQILREELEESPLLNPPPDLLETLSDGSTGDGKQLGETICRVLDLQRAPSYLTILMRYDMTPEMLFSEMRPMLERAMQCENIIFLIMIDEMNATKMLGLIKRIIVDRYWDMWEDLYPKTRGKMPANVAFVGAVNPSKKDASLEGIDNAEADEGSEHLGFDVTPMPPSLMEHVVPWKQLAEDQRKMFISRLVASNKCIFSANIKPERIDILSSLLRGAHQWTQRMSQNKRTTVSQREIHRAMKLFDFFFQRKMDYVYSPGTTTHDLWKVALSSMLLGIAVSYYFRFPPEQRKQLSDFMSKELHNRLRVSAVFSDVVSKCVGHYCNKVHLKLPEAVYSHQGLMENLFVQMICFHLRIAVILQGAPGTSKTLSNSIIRDNMTGTGTFWRDLCHISDICRYQGSFQSSAEEIKRKCVEAYEKQKESDNSGTRNKRTLLFVDEAGLVNGEADGRKWALKVLHYYLEGANLASVLMTNQSLDPAIGNRCIVVYMAKPRPEELANMCSGILHKHGVKGLTESARQIIPACCDAFRKLVPPPAEDEQTDLYEKYRWWYGLRDLFHMMRYIRRYTTEESGIIAVTPELVLRALERNFNGPVEYFEKVLQIFGEALGGIDKSYSTGALKKHLQGKLPVFIDSIKDNNRALDTSAGKNLNDMWVRFKLVVDYTEDGSILQLLRQSKVHNFNDLSVLSLSALSADDNLLPVVVVSQIAAAMETGKSVWLTNTRLIDACLFDVFNQNYVVASGGNNEVLHFVAVAVGAALEYKRVHKDFQCIVHVTKAELAGMGKVLPSPFLNRLEKFTLSVDDIVEYLVNDLPMQERLLAAQCRQLLESFERTLSVRNRCVFSDAPRELFDSIILEAIQGGTLKPLEVNPEVAKDIAIQRFLAPPKNEYRVWRTMSCRMLQLLRPEGMLIAQRVLKESAPAYLRAYFRNLSPWSFTGYINKLRERARKEKGWLRSTIYSPNNVDFLSLLAPLGETFISIHDLLESERGHEDLQEALRKFCLDSNASVFVIVMRPQSIGRPECREIKDILCGPPPDLGPAASMSGKAVVVLQPFQTTVLTDGGGCTPIFGTGWDQVFIDAAAENAKIDLFRYVDPDIVGRRSPKPHPNWKEVEGLLSQAINTLMQAQNKASEKWVPIKGDPAGFLYDMSKPLGVAKKLFERCPSVRQTLLELHRNRLPTKQEMVEMGTEVAAVTGDLSMAQRLIDEEKKAPRALLIIALRHLLTDRNASALLMLEGTNLQRSDIIMSQLLNISCQPTTFDMLRRMNVNSLETLVVGATVPALPGSSSLIEILHVSSDATDVLQTASELEAKYNEGLVGDLVSLVDQDEACVLAFFKDCIASRVRYRETNVVHHTVDWVFELSRGLHYSYFKKPETVWSVRALCSVATAAIDDYILAMTPLAAMGALDHIKPTASLSKGKQEDGWVTHELGPKLLIEALPRLASTANGLEQFRMACSSMLHRVTPGWATTSRYIPCLAVVGALLSGETTNLQKVIEFTTECMKLSTHVPLHIASLKHALDATPEVIPKVVLELSRLSVDLRRSEQLCSLIIELSMSAGVTRAMAARILSNLASPQEVLASSMLSSLFMKSAEASGKITKPPYTFTLPVTNKNVRKEAKTTLQAKIYTTAYDVCYDSIIGMNNEKIHDHHSIAKTYLAHRQAEKNKQGSSAWLLYSAVYKRALEVSFLQALALVFSRPSSVGDKSWAPSFMEEAGTVATVSKVAKLLMEPAGFVCPARKTLKEVVALPDINEQNIMIFLRALQKGVGNTRGMGTQGMLEFLQDQVSSDKDEALPVICGQGMKYKCQTADALETRPGDLPFLYQVDDKLYDPFLSVRRTVSNLVRGKVNVLSEKLSSLCSTFSLEQVRLLLFYTAYKCYFGEKEVHPLAEEISNYSAIAKLLKLKASQQRMLHIGFNNKKCKSFSNGSVDITKSLLEGFSDEWTEMICSALVVACAKPDSLLGSLFLDIDLQKSCYMPGDRTSLPITEGGCYKFDCVTQLDEHGKIAEYGKSQPVMSKGACYLLWGLEFGAMAMQLTCFPETFNTMSQWIVSPALHMRRFAYQRGLTDYRHLVGQLTERSVAYHLHMGSNTGMSTDEAQRMYAFFVYELMGNNVMGKQQHRSRDEALSTEREVERFWKRYSATGRGVVLNAGNCQTLMALHKWEELSKPDDLPRFGNVYTDLACLSAEKVPKLLDIALNDNEKLSLLAPLLTDIYSFSSRVHRMLSNRLLIKYTRSSEEVYTPYDGVLALFERHTPKSHFDAAAAHLARIKTKWNNFMERVGPIDFECEAGGINITMGSEVLVGSAGLPDTLDFWITLDESTDQNHRNLVKAALMSLIDKYNKCQSVVVDFTKTMMEDVDPVMLNPSKPDLLLREHNGLGEVCRSHVRPQGIDWKGIENELRFASGLILPRLTMPDLPPFRFLDPDEPVTSTSVEQSALDLLAMQPDKHLLPMSEALTTVISTAVRLFSEDQVTCTLTGLMNTFKAHDLKPNDVLYPALAKKWNQDVGIPSSCLALKSARVGHLQALIRFFLKKMEYSDWTTAHISIEYQVELPAELNSSIDKRLQHRLTQQPPESVLEELEAVGDTIGMICNNASAYLGAPASSLMELLAGVMMDDEDGICSVFAGVDTKHVVHFIRFLRLKLRKLRNQITSKVWAEEGAQLQELPVCIDDGGKGIVFDDNLMVTSVQRDSCGSRAGISKGMQVIAFNGKRMASLKELQTCMSAAQGTFELAVYIQPHEVFHTSRVSLLDDRVDIPHTQWSALCAFVKLNEREQTVLHVS
eukprot:TRINITY_DN2237_c1_g1_i1.p1 TRINITY_DN2237_c1_g1~~TRINITY_DN2237_c1_g1_i1.p1  ORF type:complete len:5789 (+),score=898.80 TRINITY_DN2237_c1_g1_i1:2607-17369(+)